MRCFPVNSLKSAAPRRLRRSLLPIHAGRLTFNEDVPCIYHFCMVCKNDESGLAKMLKKYFGSGNPQPRAHLVHATKIGHMLTHPLSSVRVCVLWSLQHVYFNMQNMCVHYNLAWISQTCKTVGPSSHDNTDGRRPWHACTMQRTQGKYDSYKHGFLCHDLPRE